MHRLDNWIRVALATVLVTTALVGMTPLPAQAAAGLSVLVDRAAVIKCDALKRASVTSPKIAEVVPVSATEVLVQGISPGVTTVYIWDKNGRSEVTVAVRSASGDLASELRKYVPNKKIKITTMREMGKGPGFRLLLEGQVESQYDHDRAVKIAEAFAGTANVIDLIEVTGVFQNPADHIQKILGLTEVNVQVVYAPSPVQQGPTPGSQGSNPALQVRTIAGIILEGYVDDQRDRIRAETIAKAYSPNVTNMIEVVNPIQVMVEAHLVEISRNTSRQLGIAWGSSVGASGAADSISVGTFTPNTVNFMENLYRSSRGDVSSYGPRVDPTNAFPWEFENLNRVDPLFATLQFQMSNGQARIIESPKVVTKSGTEAQIFVGGGIPTVQLTQVGGSSGAGPLEPYGFDMTITPDVDHKGNINADIQISMKNPDNGRGVTIGNTFQPAYRERRTKNFVTVRDGEHIIISGLISQEEQKSIGGIPILKDVPVLGKLFRSESFTRGETELVVVVTPYLLASKKLQDQFSSMQRAQVMRHAAPMISKTIQLNGDESKTIVHTAFDDLKTLASVGTQQLPESLRNESARLLAGRLAEPAGKLAAPPVEAEGLAGSRPLVVGAAQDQKSLETLLRSKLDGGEEASASSVRLPLSVLGEPMSRSAVRQKGLSTSARALLTRMRNKHETEAAPEMEEAMPMPSAQPLRGFEGPAVTPVADLPPRASNSRLSEKINAIFDEIKPEVERIRSPQVSAVTLPVRVAPVETGQPMIATRPAASQPQAPAPMAAGPAPVAPSAPAVEDRVDRLFMEIKAKLREEAL